MPRTEAVTYHTLQPFLPTEFSNVFVFSGLYCVVLFFLTCQHTKVIDIIGRFLSPIKLASFITLIIAGLLSAHPIMVNHNSVVSSVKEGLLDGYSTMDLLATSVHDKNHGRSS